MRRGILKLGKRFLELGDGSLTIAELHLGAVPGFRDFKLVVEDVNETFSNIHSLLKEQRAEELIILGDLKENIGLPPFSVRKAMNRGIEALLDYAVRNIKIIKGNHDGKIEEFLDMKGVSFGKIEEKTINEKEVALFHGHKFFSVTPYDFIVTAHIHPAASISSGPAAKSLVKAWAMFTLAHPAGKTRWVVMPAFSQRIKGVALNKLSKKEIRQFMPFQDKEKIEIKQLKLWYTDLTPLETKTFE